MAMAMQRGAEKVGHNLDTTKNHKITIYVQISIHISLLSFLSFTYHPHIVTVYLFAYCPLRLRWQRSSLDEEEQARGAAVAGVEGEEGEEGEDAAASQGVEVAQVVRVAAG